MSKTQALRIAVEGCAHGTLDAIYASVEKSCEVKGWDSVDLVIICGDFQAVRTQQDLNVTAMPATYRRMGDFQQYYYGSKVAPYLTIFIGGNHEASNYLFELYYGGWAAPNIYYLGAANVVKIGPIKIAATSGVYKKYDYRKPHFERLPYNGAEMRSIYHQRELDVRKLLSYTSQVDIGLSHDWPSGIEWLGDHAALFKKKGYLLPEAKTGDLGSKPSAWVMDRLRPPYWFSAHHHIRYPAYKTHDDFEEEHPVTNADSQAEDKAQIPTPNKGKAKEKPTFVFPQKLESSTVYRSIDEGAVAAWKDFKRRVGSQDAAGNAREDDAIEARRDEQGRTGRYEVAPYAFQEDFRKIDVDRSNVTQDRQARSPERKVVPQIPQLDGSCCSLPDIPKRRRDSSPSDDTQPSTRTRLGGQFDGSTSNVTVNNPDAIDIDMSSSSSDSGQRPLLTPTGSIEEEAQPVAEHGFKRSRDANGLAQATEEDLPDQKKRNDTRPEEFRSFSRTSEHMPSIKEVKSRESVRITKTFTDGAASEEGVIVNDTENHTMTEAPTSIEQNTSDDTRPTTAVTDHLAVQNPNSNGTVELRNRIIIDPKADSDIDMEGVQVEVHVEDSDDSDTDIPDDLRAELAGMSSAFAPENKVAKSPDLPFPKDISNKTTRFLALSKVETNSNNDFLQLLEIEPYMREDITVNESRSLPYELEYDPQWLAITRVFAPELKLGGSPKDRIPTDRGETYYREKIQEEEKWVQENIVDKGLLKIPQNFKVQTEQQDPTLLTKEEKVAMPRELTNPQTSEFCKLVGIDNPFDFDEEERDTRMEEGPAPDEWQEHGGGRGRTRGGGRNKRGNRGGRGRGGRRGKGHN